MSFEILNPSAIPELPVYESAPRLKELKGKKIWILDNQGEQWASSNALLNPIFRQWAEMLEADGAVVSYACTEQFTSPFRHGKEKFEEVAADADAVVTGLACCGSGTSAVIHDAIQYEKRSIPAMALITDNTVPFAKASVKKMGVPGLKYLTVSYKVHAFAPIATDEECRRIAKDMYDDFVACLLEPK